MEILYTILIIFILIIILIFNYFINLKNKVKRSKSLIEVYLQKRFDLIPNLVEVTKAYCKYEKDTLTKVIELREEYSIKRNFNIASQVNKQIDTILAIVENYPGLKANEQFKILQKNLVKIEDELQAARRIYNMDVTKYNIKISQFPNNILAKVLNFKEETLFEAEIN